MGRLLLSTLLLATLAAGCARKSGQGAARKTLNLSSPLTLLAVKDRLRLGMPIEEFDQIIAENNTGPNKSTKVMSHALVEGDPPKANPKKGMRTYYLRDADLIVVTEFVGGEDEPQEHVVSWRSEPLRENSHPHERCMK